MGPLSKKKETWRRITSRFSSSLRPDDFETWISPIRLTSLEADLAVIEVPNRFFADWIKERYLPDLRIAFKEVAAISPEIRFTVRRGQPDGGTVAPFLQGGLLPVPNPDLHPEMTFDAFVRSHSNAFAYFSCLEIADNNPRSYTPLCLFSEKSTGKTHLLHALGNRMAENHPDYRTRYVHADRFTSEFTRALRSDRVHPFRSAYAELDLLLFDDVHLLAGRSKTQQEFTLAVNAMLREGKMVTVTSRVAPFRLPDTNPRMKSILSWGLLAEIHPPEPETRVQVVRRQTDREGIPLPDDIIFFLAKSNDDMKQLLRNVTRVQTYVSLNGGSINLSAVRNLIRDPAGREAEIEDIQAITAGYFKVSVSDLSSGKRQRSIAYPRQMAMYLCKKYTELSYKKIGNAFDKKDHSTVIYAVQRIEKQLSRQDVREDLKNLENLIG
ncbi:MAG: chromosomal replication initiator protein DnaA [Deltaproteobacteria bacterium]|nr:chromosomal replication initiator protein DnaA [Deltaproteobacteria bacterium]